MTTNELNDAEIISTLQLAYRWGYPLLAMAINNQDFYGPTMNAFYHMKNAADDKSQNDRGFNAEVLYSAGALDLRAEPMVLSLPKMGDRFFVFPVQDAWGNIDNVIGTRTEGNEGGTYLVCGPDWIGEAPAGMKHFRTHTNIAFLPGRTMVKSPEDAREFAATVQDHITITPLNRWGQGFPNSNRDSLKDPLTYDPAKNYNTVLARTSTEDYFNKLNDLLVTNRPYDYDAPVLEQFARLGIGPGLKFDIKMFSPAVVSAMEEFGHTDVAATARLFAEKGMDHRLRALCCRFGTSYYERYYCLFGGLGGNLMEDAVYYWLTTDTNGATLNGTKNYIVHFDASQIPHVRAFWSLTLYTKDFFFAKDMPLNRHMLNSNSGMLLNPDGSLDIYLQAENPGKEKEANWLPVPQDEYFTLLRVYWPEDDLLTGEWRMPDITEVK